MSEKATFGAGCFWSVEEVFMNLPGVQETAVGYMGGITINPTYQEVCTDQTGHAEVAQVVFDPQEISYEQLLEVFWQAHDPTQLNRQGWDIGRQYRSVIFYHTPEQADTAKRSKELASARFSKPIATEIAPATEFYRAEEYHQKYHLKQGGHCSI